MTASQETPFETHLDLPWNSAGILPDWGHTRGVPIAQVHCARYLATVDRLYRPQSGVCVVSR